MARRIESLLLDGPAGKLEALLEEPEHSAPGRAALVCHPHPRHGGTMLNKVVYRMARGLRRAGAVVLRFNFRGVGRSQGEYARGIGEVEDARAALTWLRQRYPGLPYLLAGFSFGSRVILNMGCEPSDASLLIAAGFPTRYKDLAFLQTCVLPKVIVQSTHDQYAPRPEVEEFFARMAPPKRLVWIEARDHFFAGALERFEQQVAELAAPPKPHSGH